MSTLDRTAHHRHYLMCRPERFTVSYAINPWMDPTKPTSTTKALEQWQALYDLYRALGHTVDLIDPLAGYPDMVYTANGGFVIDSRAYVPKFYFTERQGEAPAFAHWFRSHGYDTVEPQQTNEGEGDFLLAGNVILAGMGFRSAGESHDEVAEVFDREVVSLGLTDPRFYHLDTALTVLDPVQGVENGGPERVNIAYLPGAFDEPSRSTIQERFPEAIEVSDADGAVFGLNASSDGKNVITSLRATGFHAQLKERGYNPITLDLSELLLGGGGIKCCTLELRGSELGNSELRDLTLRGAS